MNEQEQQAMSEVLGAMGAVAAEYKRLVAERDHLLRVNGEYGSEIDAKRMVQCELDRVQEEAVRRGHAERYYDDHVLRWRWKDADTDELDLLQRTIWSVESLLREEGYREENLQKQMQALKDLLPILRSVSDLPAADEDGPHE